MPPGWLGEVTFKHLKGIGSNHCWIMVFVCVFLLFLDLPIKKLERLQVSSSVEGPGSAAAETIPGRAEQIETCEQPRQVAQLTGKWVGWAT